MDDLKMDALERQLEALRKQERAEIVKSFYEKSDEARPDFSMTDDDFKAFADYQLHICEKREMLGNSSHLLYICRKTK
jgi:hypothetical protein